MSLEFAFWKYLYGGLFVIAVMIFFGGIMWFAYNSSTTGNAIKETTPTDPCALSNVDACWKGCVLMQHIVQENNRNQTQEKKLKEFCGCAAKCGLEYDKDDTEYYNESYC